MDNIVAWLYERGENPDEFIERIVKRCAAFEAVPARSVLRSYLPFVSSFYSAEDARELCLEIIPKRYPFLTKASILRNEIVDGNRRVDFTFQFETPGVLAANPMRWIRSMINIGPLLLNTPAYEHISYLASQTSFIEALENRVPAEMKEDGGVYVKGELVGRHATFADCVKEHNLEISVADWLQIQQFEWFTERANHLLSLDLEKISYYETALKYEPNIKGTVK
jgi:hypothetical protein